MRENNLALYAGSCTDLIKPALQVVAPFGDALFDPAGKFDSHVGTDISHGKIVTDNKLTVGQMGIELYEKVIRAL